MIDQRLETNKRQEDGKIRKEFSTLVGDSYVRMSKFEGNVSRATDDLTTWVEGGVSQLSDGFEKLSVEAGENAVNTVQTVKKDVGHRLSQYNAEAQKVADNFPGGFGEKAARYPWVAITIALVVGFWFGSLFKSI